MTLVPLLMMVAGVFPVTINIHIDTCDSYYWQVNGELYSQSGLYYFDEDTNYTPIPNYDYIGYKSGSHYYLSQTFSTTQLIQLQQV